MLESTVQRWVFEYGKIASLNMSDNITGFFRKTGFSNLCLSQIFEMNAPREREEKTAFDSRTETLGKWTGGEK